MSASLTTTGTQCISFLGMGDLGPLQNCLSLAQHAAQRLLAVWGVACKPCRALALPSGLRMGLCEMRAVHSHPPGSQSTYKWHKDMPLPVQVCGPQACSQVHM
jgi:hypothetical protein